MPKYYCDYCDKHLTHDSMKARRDHNAGFRHRDMVRNHYAKIASFYAQQAIDMMTRNRPPPAPIQSPPLMSPPFANSNINNIGGGGVVMTRPSMPHPQSHLQSSQPPQQQQQQLQQQNQFQIQSTQQQQYQLPAQQLQQQQLQQPSVHGQLSGTGVQGVSAQAVPQNLYQARPMFNYPHQHRQ
ncbi:hypothetical protein MIR68_005303 [Amoeboaphelidium protococcarum]|nr:hypothetical protein MIR68_005303 [Amoeboaphelidium protococcarum]